MIEPGMHHINDYLHRFPRVTERVARSKFYHAWNYPEKFRVDCTCGAIYKGTVYSELDHYNMNWIREQFAEGRNQGGSFEATKKVPFLITEHHPNCQFINQDYVAGLDRRYYDSFKDEWKSTHSLFELDVLDADKLLLRRSNLRVRKEGEGLIAAVQPILHVILDRNGVVSSTLFQRRKGCVVGRETDVPMTPAEVKKELGKGLTTLRSSTYIDDRVEDHPVWNQTGLKEWADFTTSLQAHRWPEYLAYQAKNPAAEQLVKMAQASYVSAKMHGGQELGDSYKQAVEVPASYLYRLRGSEANVVHWLERLHKNDPLTEEQIEWFAINVRGESRRKTFLERAAELVTEHGYTTARLFDYMATIEFRQAIDIDEAMQLLYDYRVMAATLEEVDLPKYPGSLKLQHDLASRRYAFLSDERKESKFQSLRLRRQEAYEVQATGYLIRLPETLAEIVEEGKKLNHCVASYADKVANGQTMILFARKVNDPDTPWITIEVRDEHLIQARGYGNRNYTEIDADFATFLHKWKKHRNIR